MKKMFRTISALILMTIIGISCNETVEITFSDFDLDGDDLIDQDEFVNSFTDFFYNEGEFMDEEAFYLATFEVWDLDEDGVLDNEEWDTASDYYYGNYIIQNVQGVDKNGDNVIDYKEFHDVIIMTDFFDDWKINVDEYLAPGEFAQGVFNAWDSDDSGYIELDEYNFFIRYYNLDE